jgi:hypothetical protein
MGGYFPPLTLGGHMATNKIRVKSSSIYTIEVNDEGDTIQFDMTDTGLASKMVKAFDKINELTEEYQNKASEIDARPDEPYRKTDIDGEEKTVITKNQYDGAQMIDELYTKARKALDEFLGENACQKIFGDNNYYSMFEDLTEQLKPHLEKMGLDAQALKAKTVNKYMPNRESRRALK